ncbi:MAG: GNAT family N-acetyltransferase [Actinomycetota bacterium]|nr:GNAT family N-acetyltransferase [Actinomycetota bacterium]
MTTAVHVRAYESRDHDVCSALWEDLTEWHRMLYARHEIGELDAGREHDRHLARVGAQNIWVAEVDGVVAGFAALVVDGERGELEPVIVSAAHRRRGVGERLVAAVIAAARERGLRQLKVRPVARNTHAIRFFRWCGFDVLGHLDLLMDLVPREGGPWRAGERIANRDFRV